MNLNHLIIPITIAVILILILVLIACGYVKAPPDQAYIISGLKHDAKILIGRSGIRIPFFERMDRLYLGQMTVDIKTEQSVPTNDFINVNVDAVAKVRITPSQEGIRLAAKNFLNKKPEDITMDLQDSLQGNMREIIGTLSLKEINTDRDSFSDQVMLKASGILVLTTPQRSRRTPRSQKLRQTAISPSPRQKRTNLPTMPAYLRRQRSRRKIMSWRSVSQSFRSTPTRRKRRQTLLMRSRSRNRKKRSRQLP